MAEEISTTYQKIANNLVQFRERKGLDQMTASVMLKWNKSRLGSYERGERLPDLDTLKQLARFYEVELWELMGEPGMKQLDETETKFIELLRKIKQDQQAIELVFVFLETWIAKLGRLNGFLV